MQQQQSQSQSFGARGHSNADAEQHLPPGAMMNMSQQQMMMMPADQHRYMQEMRRAEELLMASQAVRGGGAPGRGMSEFSGMARNSFPMMGSMSQERSSASSRGGGGGADSVARMPSQEMAPTHDPATLLALLQQEQERLVAMQRQQGVMAESWLPAAKRQRLPPNMNHPWMPQGAQQQAAYHHQLAAAAARPEHKERKRHVKSFPMKLMEAINEHYDEKVVAWLPDGKSFVVVDPDSFVEHVLSATFKGGKYTSFVRKLNRWGFSRLISGSGTDCFHNSLFQRDRPDLCALITSGDSDDTIGVDPDVLGHKPSLTGIEKYFDSPDGKTKSGQGVHQVSSSGSEVNDEAKETGSSKKDGTQTVEL